MEREIYKKRSFISPSLKVVGRFAGEKKIIWENWRNRKCLNVWKPYQFEYLEKTSSFAPDEVWEKLRLALALHSHLQSRFICSFTHSYRFVPILVGIIFENCSGSDAITPQNSLKSFNSYHSSHLKLWLR